MLKKNKVARIHELYEKEHASIKTICKILNISRNTVRRYLVRQNSRDMKHRSSLICAITVRKVRAIFNSCNKTLHQRCSRFLRKEPG